jgi:isopenicillin N synthase-like dioxygenase
MKEAFNVGLELAADDPDLLAGKPFRSLNAWSGAPGFRETLLSYYDACAGLGARLHRAFARDLGLRADFFDGKFDRLMATLRLLHYPAPPRVARRRPPARASTRITATSLCSRPTMSAASTSARAPDNGSKRQSSLAPSSSTSAIA